MNHAEARSLIDSMWSESIVPQLVNYIRIPCKSPLFDPRWKANGHIDNAVALLADWARQQPVAGMQLSVEQLPGHTPLMFIDVPGEGDRSALIYGHLDKQPEMSGWRDGFGPWIPVLEDDRLYGRGGADDGYALFAALAAVRALQQQGLAHANLKIVIEASEESGSPDLPAYMEALAARIGNPDLIICLDSGCGDYDRLWSTTSLRGIAAGTLRVEVLTEGVHSGDAGGIVPSSFRILRHLLSRLEDEASGSIRVDACHVTIPPQRAEQARDAATILGHSIVNKFPFHVAPPIAADGLSERVLDRTWRPALEVTGVNGLPSIADAGNVLRPFTAARLSLRVPPTCRSRDAAAALKQVLEADPPPGARVSFSADQMSDGWNAPATAPWLATSAEHASRSFFGAPAAYMGEGGTIPFMAMLGEAFPTAQFLITGVLGPQSNAHGPNEFLHLPTARKLSACVAQVIADHHRTGGN